MKKLTQNITNIFGEKGAVWLANLPAILEVICAKWGLRNLSPVDNMSFNYVAKAITQANEPVVLKISCDGKSIIDERYALRHVLKLREIS